MNGSPFINLRPEIPQWNHKADTRKLPPVALFHFFHGPDQQIQMEFRLHEIQCQGKIIPLYDEFMQLLKSPGGELLLGDKKNM